MRPEVRRTADAEWFAKWDDGTAIHYVYGDSSSVLAAANEAVIDWQFASIVEIGACS